MRSGTWRYLLGKISKLVLTLRLKEIRLGLEKLRNEVTKILNYIFNMIAKPDYYLRRSHILSIEKL